MRDDEGNPLADLYGCDPNPELAEPAVPLVWAMYDRKVLHVRWKDDDGSIVDSDDTLVVDPVLFRMAKRMKDGQ
jgi:hypothetical protein